MVRQLHLIVVWFHWKLHTRKEGNWSGRSRERRILLTCIQLLLIQFLGVIWSMPKNFAFFQKPLDKFFYKFDNPEINCQEIFPASFKNIENGEDISVELSPFAVKSMFWLSSEPIRLQEITYLDLVVARTVEVNRYFPLVSYCNTIG